MVSNFFHGRPMDGIKIFILMIVFSFSTAFGAVGIGGYVPYIGVYQKNKTSTGNSTNFRPFVSAVGRYKVIGRFYFRPEIGRTLSYRPNASGNERQKASSMFGLLNFGVDFLSSSFLNFGIGTFWNKIESKAGLKEFSNGSSTSVFYFPAGSQTSMSSTVNIGIEQGIGPLSLSFMTYWFQPFVSEDRTLSYSLAFNYFLK